MNKKTIVLLILIMLLVFPYFASSVTEFMINETEKIALNPDAVDPDSDSLIAAYTLPLDENGEWQTNYGDEGAYPVTVTVSDGITSVSKDVLIIVNKKEEAPIIESFAPNQDYLAVNEGDSIGFRISAMDLNRDSLGYEWLVDNNKAKDGQDFSYSPSYNEAGKHIIAAVVSDGTLHARKEWEVNVENVDRQLIFEKIHNLVVNENDQVEIALHAYDPDIGDNITYSAENMPYGASLEGNVFRWTPGYDINRKNGFVDRIIDKFSTLSRNFYIKFNAASRGKNVVQNVVITVKDVNRAPVIEDIAPISIRESEQIIISPKAYDPDGDRIKLSYSGFLNTNTYRTKFGDSGTYEVQVKASDGVLGTSKPVRINISHVNRAPLFEKIKNIKAKEGDEIAVLLSASDPDSDEITYSIDNPPQGSELKGNTFLWKPEFDTASKKETRKFDLIFAAGDGMLQSRQVVQAEISDTNKVPRIVNATRFLTASVNKPVLMSVRATDDDGDELSYTWKFGFFEKYTASELHQRIFTSRGTKIVKVIVSDGTDSAEQQINVNVI